MALTAKNIYSINRDGFTLRTFEYFYSHECLRHLHASQWGSLHALITQPSSPENRVERVRDWLGKQRAKATKRDDVQAVAAYGALSTFLDGARELTMELAARTLDAEALSSGKPIGDDLLEDLHEVAARELLHGLIRIARIHEVQEGTSLVPACILEDLKARCSGN